MALWTSGRSGIGLPGLCKRQTRQGGWRPHRQPYKNGARGAAQHAISSGVLCGGAPKKNLPPKRTGINAPGDEAGKSLFHSGFVFAVGDAIPAVFAGEDVDARVAVFDEGIYDGGDEELCFGLLLVIEGEALEHELGGVEYIGVEAPEIHGYKAFFAKGVALAVVAEVSGPTIGLALDFEAFVDLGEQALLVGGGYAPIDGAVFGEGIAQDIADHGEGRGGTVFAQEAGHSVEGVGAVVVVGIDDGEGLLYRGAGYQHGVGGAPGFFAEFGIDARRHKAVFFLEHVCYRNAAFEAIADFFFKRGFDVFANNKDYFAEAGADGVVDGILYDGFLVGAYAVYLLEAAIAAAHAGGEDNETRLTHFSEWLVRGRSYQKPVGRKSAEAAFAFFLRINKATGLEVSSNIYPNDAHYKRAGAGYKEGAAEPNGFFDLKGVKRPDE